MSDASAPIVEPDSVPVSVPARTARLGLVAMIAAIAVFVVSLILAGTLGSAAGPYSIRNGGGFSFHFNVGDPNPAINALAIAMLLHVALGTGVGLWALIQGIVATATSRGRRFGIIAIVFAGLAPGLSLVTFFVTAAANLPPI
jgi:hypothetical protein